jgi:hypothetical protein
MGLLVRQGLQVKQGFLAQPEVKSGPLGRQAPVDQLDQARPGKLVLLVRPDRRARYRWPVLLGKGLLVRQGSPGKLDRLVRPVQAGKLGLQDLLDLLGLQALLEKPDRLGKLELVGPLEPPQ